MSRENYWTNSDGLRVGFGTRASTDLAGVERSPSGNLIVRLPIKAVDLEAVGSVTVASLEGRQGARIPRGSVVKSAHIQVHTAFDSAGDAGILNVGFIDADDATADDVDSLFDSVAQAYIDSVGAVVAASTTPLVVGATADNDVTPVASYETAAFTAGEAVVVMELILPSDFNQSLAV